MTDPVRQHNVTVVGRPDAARTMVFVHGFGTDQRAWSRVWPAFADEFRIVLFDNAGAGGSDPAAFQQHRYLTLDRYAQDLCELLQAMRLRDVVLVGHSLGAMTALLTGIARPDLVARIVAIGASPRYLDDPADGYRGGFSEDDPNRLYHAVTVGRDEWADAFAPQVMANPGRPALARHFAETIKSVPNDAVLTVLCSIFQSDYREAVGRLERPALLLQTASDIAVPPSAAELLHRRIRGSRLEILDAEGHLPHVSAPELVVAAMRDFVRAG